jgi:hypothetical protein
LLEEEDDVSVCCEIDACMTRVRGLDMDDLLSSALGFCEEAGLCNQRLALQRGVGLALQRRIVFPDVSSRRRSPFAPGSASSSPPGIFGSIASFLSRSSNTSPTSPPVLPRVCAFCATEEGEIGLYKWASLGEARLHFLPSSFLLLFNKENTVPQTVARAICAKCFATLLCQKCGKHRPDVEEGVCGSCNGNMTRERSGTIGEAK